MSRDFMMDTLLKTMFIARREDNDGNIQELAVESHEHINIQAMAARKEEKEDVDEVSEEKRERGRGRITIKDLIR
jgi:hypothetical protein